MVLAPEHPLVSPITTGEQRSEVEAYVRAAGLASEIERQAVDREKTGVFTGAYCVNHLTGDRVPIWIADYALATYGTGAVMAVPAHDHRDFEFAGKFGLPVQTVIAPPDWDGEPLTGAFVEAGTMVNSGSFDGLPSEEGKEAITSHLEAQGWGGAKIQYRLRDWLISRQRYWGAPIPMVYCAGQCGIVPVPEEQLPIELPYDVEFLPTGQSPLALSDEFVRTTCPECEGPARRETDTMDTFMCSSWYYMRYADAVNAESAIAPEPATAWLPVDQYTGGAEHATMHLLYARFFYKAARDAGIVPGDEPFTRYFAQGQILGPDGRRMSKSRGNVVPPDDQVEQWGADTFRAYLMFLGPWDQGGPYDVEGIVGVARWLRRVWTLAADPPAHGGAAGGASREALREAHRTLERVTADYEGFHLNTAVAAMMELTNTLVRTREAGPVDAADWDESLRLLLLMLAPICPARHRGAVGAHGAAPTRCTSRTGRNPIAALSALETVELPVQINGRLRDRIDVSPTATEAEARAQWPRRGSASRSCWTGASRTASSTCPAGCSTSSCDRRMTTVSRSPQTRLHPSARPQRAPPGLRLAGALLLACSALLAACLGEEDAEPVPAEGASVETIRTRDGLRLDARLFAAEPERIVILLHMFPADQTAWYPFARELQALGITALTLDFRGYGASEGEQDPSEIDHDVRAAIAFVREPRLHARRARRRLDGRHGRDRRCGRSAGRRRRRALRALAHAGHRREEHDRVAGRATDADRGVRRPRSHERPEQLRRACRAR